MGTALATFALAALVTPLGAGPPALDSGARLRVTVTEPGARTLTGTLEALRVDGLRLRVGERSETIPMSAIRRVEVSRGRHPSTRWTVIGAVVGATTGSLVGGCLANKDDYGVACAGQDDTKYLIGGIVGGVVGGALGAWLSRSERWEEMDRAWQSASPTSRLVKPRPAAGFMGPPDRHR